VGRDPSGGEVTYKLNRGDAVSARPDVSIMASPYYRFETENGLVRVNFLPREPEWAGRLFVGWVDPKLLSVFYFECCDPKGKSCGSTDTKGFSLKFVWTSCFLEARDQHQAKLAAAAPSGPAKTVELGYTEEQVRAALGEPGKILKLGEKAIWVYADLKITFVAGKVSDMQ
jgi:hypothetical protein